MFSLQMLIIDIFMRISQFPYIGKRKGNFGDGERTHSLVMTDTHQEAHTHSYMHLFFGVGGERVGLY